VGTDCTDCSQNLPVWEIVVASLSGIFGLGTIVIIVRNLINRRIDNIIMQREIGANPTQETPQVENTRTRTAVPPSNRGPLRVALTSIKRAGSGGSTLRVAPPSDPSLQQARIVRAIDLQSAQSFRA
tara:strand:- start:37 stop:417 length:381 start_codon:yes stop_codon:yes gene_type:complete